MKYAVYKLVHREHVRWYAKPLKPSAIEEYPYVFQGKGARSLACHKAQELNRLEGRSALAA